MEPSRTSVLRDPLVTGQEIFRSGTWTVHPSTTDPKRSFYVFSFVTAPSGFWSALARKLFGPLFVAKVNRFVKTTMDDYLAEAERRQRELEDRRQGPIVCEEETGAPPTIDSSTTP